MGFSVKTLTFETSTDSLQEHPPVSAPYALASIEVLSEAVLALGLVTGVPVMVVIGGASQISSQDFDRMRLLFQTVLAPVAQSVGATVIDGGTAAGIMQLMGEARSALPLSDGDRFPLVGIAPDALTRYPGQDEGLADAAMLEMHHSHFIGVPGTQWGDESESLARVATVIAAGAPSVAIAMNGGEVTLLDMQCNVAEGREIWAIAGTGRNTDRMIAALAGEMADERLVSLVKTGLVKGYALDEPDKLKAALLTFLGRDHHDSECGSRL